MKAATLNILKEQLEQLPTREIIMLCLRMARFKKDNKELLTFLLFEADDITGYIEGVKKEMDELFSSVNASNVYLYKKSLRKIVRTINKYIQYSLSKTVETELLIYLAAHIRNGGIAVSKSTALANIYNSQLKKIRAAISTFHEDLQYDYVKQLNQLA